MSNVSSPEKEPTRYFARTVPPKNSKLSSELANTSMYSTVVPRPTAPNVIPLISLSGSNPNPAWRTET